MQGTMLLSYLKTAVRSLLRQRIYAATANPVDSLRAE